LAEKKEVKEVIKPFKTDKDSAWFCGKHWIVIDDKLILAAGGLFEQSEYDHVYKYFRTKKIIK
jgi:hypothetical protein